MYDAANTMSVYSSSFRKVLKKNDFFNLWLGQIVASIGDRFYQFAILYVVLKSSSGFGVGKESARVLFCGMILTVFFSPWIGHIVDRFNRKKVMIFTDLARSLLTLVMLAVWLIWQSPALMFFLIAITGLMNGLFIPARQASVPLLVEGKELVTANALVTSIGVIASLFGAGIGFVVAIFGEKSSFLIASLGFLFSAWRLHKIGHQLPADSTIVHGPPLLEIREMFKEATEDRLVRLLFLLSGGAQFIIGLFLVFVLEHTAHSMNLSVLQEGVRWFSETVVALGFKKPVVEIRLIAMVLLLCSTGAGLMLGVGISTKAPRLSHYEGLPLLMFICLGISFMGFARLHDFLPAAGMTVVVAMFGALLMIPIDSRLQDHVHGGRHGRIFAAKSAWTYICFLLALGINLDGRLLAWRGAENMIEELGLACMVAGMLLCVFNAGRLKKFWNPSAN